MTQLRRAESGSALTEFGPALLFLFVAVFFPLLDLSVLGLTYCSCATLNDLQADKAKLLPQSQATAENGPVKSAVPSAWQSTGFGAFCKLARPPVTKVSYSQQASSPCVVVATSFSANPFISIPFIPGVPGISAPLDFSVEAKRIVEDPTNLSK